ncbi:DUF6173 family protein [uncultured Cocleimonas sp.]|uniref:DUF6173 family protein n=1 Tax=uncultured Cocleimonas sp. TaxID=1051587 RepID=UPI002605DAA4|nr:DUF6173 family protein [uncultured Cocleimonas sp.]
MEATCCNFEKEDIFNTILLKSKAAISNCQILISSKLTQNINNTDIVIWINDLHKSLDDDHEAGMQIDHLGKQVVFYIDHIAYKNNSMIYFKGSTENGKQVHFVKHFSDLNIKLIALKRRSSDQQKTPFGFADWAEYKAEKSKLN